MVKSWMKPVMITHSYYRNWRMNMYGILVLHLIIKVLIVLFDMRKEIPCNLCNLFWIASEWLKRAIQICTNFYIFGVSQKTLSKMDRRLARDLFASLRIWGSIAIKLNKTYLRFATLIIWITSLFCVKHARWVILPVKCWNLWPTASKYKIQSTLLQWNMWLNSLLDFAF